MDKTNENPYLAFDLGATSWRAALGHDRHGEIVIEEIYREKNVPIQNNKGMFWDIECIFQGMLKVMSNLSQQGIRPAAIGIDSWSVDYALLDADGQLLEPPRCYRDPRNDGNIERLARLYNLDDLFNRTGVMMEDITTLCQLMATQKQTPQLLNNAVRLLFIPDLLRFWLCDQAKTDFTLASTSQLYNLAEKTWDTQLLTSLNLPIPILPEVITGSSVLGGLSDKIQKCTNMGPVPVVTGASHDTAAAFYAVNISEDRLILSSGTWSILGLTLANRLPASVGLDFYRYGYEGHPTGSLRLVHNVPGMYLLECCRQHWQERGDCMPYDDLIQQAKSSDFPNEVDPFWPGFNQAGNMPQAMDDYFRQIGQSLPQSPADYARSIFMGLAKTYAQAIGNFRRYTGRNLKELIIVGGGSKNQFLNQLIAQHADIQVKTSHSEASILGNIITQKNAL